MAELLLDVEKRKDVGKQTSKKLRREGRVPAIYYIHGEESVPLSVDEKQLHHAIHTEASILELKLDSGKKMKCVIRDIQWHPLYDRPIHVDLMGVKMTEKVHVDVPVHLVGEAVGVKRDGGILQQVVREVTIESLPADIPEHIEIDISSLEIGDTFRVEQIEIENVRMLSEATQTIVVVRPPKVEVEPVAVEEEVAEPELVGEKKEEESKEAEAAPESKEE